MPLYSRRFPRTRSSFLPAGLFMVALATPVRALVLGTNSCWALDGTASEAVTAEWACPHDIVAGTTVTLKIIWTKSTAGSGDVLWKAQTRLAGDGGIMSADNIPSGSGLAAAVPAASGIWKYTTLSSDCFSGTSPLPGSNSQIYIERMAAIAGDTYDGADAWLRGILLEYTADD